VLLAEERFKAGSRATTLTVTFPAPAAFHAKQADLDRLTKSVAGPDWFAFTPSDNLGPSVIGMEDWLEKPAGKHGVVQSVADRFKFADGTQRSSGGESFLRSGCAPSKKDAGVHCSSLRQVWYQRRTNSTSSRTPPNQMGIADKKDSRRMTPRWT